MNRIQDIGCGLVEHFTAPASIQVKSACLIYEDLLESTSIHDRLTSKQASSFKAICDDREVTALLGTMFIVACCCCNRFSFRSGEQRLGEVYLPMLYAYHP